MVDAYGSKERFYHTLEHIRAVLEFVKARTDQLQDRRSVELAVWFHDAVYDTKAQDNEEQSAVLARTILEKLMVPEHGIQRVEQLVRATKTHELTEEDKDGIIFLDSDLSILGTDDTTYDKYAEAIRKEYSWVSDEVYKIGRKRVLEKFLSRERIFKSAMAYQQLENKARNNIQREIAKLS